MGAVRSGRWWIGCAGQVDHGDVSCSSDHTNPFLLATLSHEERLALVIAIFETTRFVGVVRTPAPATLFRT